MKIHFSVFLLLGLAVNAVATPPTGRYKTLVDKLTALQAAYPTISKIYSIGQNDDGIEMYAIRVSTSPETMDPQKVGHVVVSTHHGNELGAPDFTMAFIADLLKRYSSDEVYRGNLSDQEFSIVPVLNISGYNANQRHEKGQDPNRDYDGVCNESHVTKLKSIQNVKTLLGSRIFAGSVTVHGYDGSLTYPWGMYTSNYETLDNNAYKSIFTKAAQFNGYRVGTAAEVVYPANGCYEDYVYYKNGSWSLLLELRDGGANDIKNTVPAIASFFDQLDSSPSVKNQHTGNCEMYDGPDLRIE